MNQHKKLIGIIAVVVIILAMMCLYTVRVDEKAMIQRLGALKGASDGSSYIAEPGLHIKWPVIEHVLIFSTKLQNLDIKSSPIVTVEKKRVIADYFVKWRIRNVPQFYKTTGGSIQNTDQLLEQQLNDALRAEFGRRTINEVVSDDRASIMQALNQKANEGAQKLGIDVVDVRIKGIDLPPEVSGSVFARMRAEREKVATELRAKGHAEGEAVRAKADAEATVIVATARKEANDIRAEGDGRAAKIYADAYTQDESFYSLYRSLEAYRRTFSNPKDIIVVTPQSQFFDYFNHSSKGATK
ncbi:MAG: hflC [Gammaproteobacteria bacterium]|nr:hflC [Gammaproteobacteria bacterium]